MSVVELKRAGLHLSGTPLWLDAHRKSELSFVSHAHSDHIARHERVIATDATLRLMKHRLGRLPPGALPAPYHRPFELGSLVLELFPAGHILGSAQLRVIRADGHRVVYTGDFSLSASLTATPLAIAECDTLVMEATFGNPRYVFPSRAQVLADVVGWARGLLDSDTTPVLLAYPLGKSQEVIRALGEAKVKICAHRSVVELCDLYRELGVWLPEVRVFEGKAEPGEVVVVPPRAARFNSVGRLTHRRTAMLSGWALDPGARLRFGADEVFPLSDHADFPSLIRYAKQTGASEILTHHGLAEELAAALREEGLDARAVGQLQQLDMFQGPKAATSGESVG